MGGKAALLLVFGFTYIFSIYQMKTGNVTTQAADNYIEYYSKTVAHEIAISGMNVAAAKVYEDSSYRTDLSVEFQDGNMEIEFNSGTDTLEVLSIANFNGCTDTVVAYFGFTSTGGNLYLEYTMFTALENGVSWTDGDQVWGPVHTNGSLNHQNKSTIIFHGKASAGKNISSPPKNAKTQFLGGYEVGGFLPEVAGLSNLKSNATSGGYAFPFPADTMKLEFMSTGNVIVYRNSVPIHPTPGVDFYTLASNGAIYSDGPVEILGGDVNTTVTGITVGSGNNVILSDDFDYADDPESNSNSDDFIGIVALNNIVFRNATKVNWDIQGALMAINGSMVATNMVKDGTFNYLGSLYQKNRGNAKMFQSFNKRYKHDIRLNGRSLPFFPSPGSGNPRLRLLSWWE